MSEPATLQEYDSHCLIRMDDGKANALGFGMFDAINASLDQAEKINKVVVIVGRPGKFSAGFDLKVMGGGGQPMVDLLRTGAELSQRLLQHPTPVVLGVSGHALAMGALLCLSADYRVGLRGDYRIGLNEVAIGMTLPWFGVTLAKERLDETRRDAAVSLARVYGPDEAVSVGYLDEAVDADAFEQRLSELAESISAIDMAAHAGTKRRLREDFLESLDAALRRDFEGGAGETP